MFCFIVSKNVIQGFWERCTSTGTIIGLLHNSPQFNFVLANFRTFVNIMPYYPLWKIKQYSESCTPKNKTQELKGGVRFSLFLTSLQCCGSLTFWRGSVPLTPGSGSCYFYQWPSRRHVFLLITFLKVLLHNFSKIKSQKKSQNSRNQGLSYYFCPKTYGSGSATLHVSILF